MRILHRSSNLLTRKGPARPHLPVLQRKCERTLPPRLASKVCSRAFLLLKYPHSRSPYSHHSFYWGLSLSTLGSEWDAARSGDASGRPRNHCSLWMPNRRHCLIEGTNQLRELHLHQWQVPMTPQAPRRPTRPRLLKKSPRRALGAQNIPRKRAPRIQIHLRQRNPSHLLRQKSILSPVERSSQSYETCRFQRVPSSYVRPRLSGR